MDKTEYLKQLINDTGLKMKAFAEKADIPYTTLRSMLERGIENASVNNVVKICKALNISVETLYDKCNKSISLSSTEKNLLSKFNKLNNEGKKEAIKRVDELAELPKYQKENNVTALPKREKQIWEEEGKEFLMPNAAHEIDGNFTEEDYQYDDDIMKDDDFWNK